jgi:hypothetical protein
MANQIAYVGAIDKYDIDLFTAYTGALDATVSVPVRVGSTNRKIAGNTLPSQLGIGALYQKQATLGALNTAVPSPILNGIAYLANTTGATGGSSAAGWVQWDGTVWQAFDIASSGSTKSYDSLTSGTVLAQVTRLGGTTTVLSNPGTGVYKVLIPASADAERISVFANGTHVAGDNSLTIQVDNAANARDRRVTVDVFAANTGTLQDVFNLGIVPTVTYTANVSSIYIPDFGGFGATGAWVEIR